ncbi:heterokaryon incompatibility protein-domain-containing protein [Xylaria scruposa]|nr:heterokaryon incompatibility protein-domain-containing protein [Xylaria scruposa]
METDSLDSNAIRHLCNKCAEYDWPYIISGYKTLTGDLEEDTKCPKSPAWGTIDVLGGAYYRRRHYPGVFFKANPHPNPNHRKTFILPLLSVGEMKDTSSTCSVCSFIIRSTLTPTSDLTKTVFWRSEWPNDSEDCLDCYVNIGSTIMSDVHITLLENTLTPSQDKFRYGRLVKPECIDVQTMKDWRSNCRQYHGQVCSQTQSEPVLPPLSAEIRAAFRVIDVKEKTVIPASPDTDYVALSYVWGKQNPGRSFRQAFLDPLPADLYQAHSLALNMEEIPRTIRDSIDVVERLGERYLWVDALCIFQDDVTHKTQMIGIMDRIYRQAVLTIIAAGGNSSDSGLGGLRPGSRNLEQVIGTICDQRIIKLSPRVGDLLSTSPWASRAWTYQEQHFSKFKLIFVGDRAFYQCPSTKNWSEDLTEYVHKDRKSRISSNIDYASEWPFDAVSSYSNYVEQYTRRQLSFPTDILNAFSGFIQEHSRTHHTEFSSGLPKRDFTSALLWIEKWHGPKAPRPHRKSDEPGLQRRHPISDKGLMLPSWSWAGWEGQVHFPFLSMPGYVPLDVDWEWESVENPVSHEVLWGSGVITCVSQFAELEPQFMDTNHGVLQTDDGSPWAQGKNPFVLLASFSRPMRYIEGAQNMESRNYIVMMLQARDKDMFHRKGLMVCADAQWEAAKPKTQTIRLS